jgi:MtrB/PioB family decaheme-associated outer membrane protein
MKINKITQLLLITLYAGLLAPVTVFAAENEEDEEDEFDNPWSTIQQVEYTNRVEIGVIYNNEDNLRKGQFDGNVDQGSIATLNIDLSNLNASDKESADFWNLQVSDLGLDSRHLAAEFGIQGSYTAFVEYSEIISRELFMNNASSAYSDGWGSDNLGSAALEFGDVDSDLKRKKFIMGATWDFASNWQMSTSIKKEDKEGSRTRGSYPGIFLAEAVDSELTEFDLGFTYAVADYQASIEFFRSQWKNNYDYMDVNNGIDQRLGVDPDNEFSQVKFDLAWRFAPKTRVYVYGAFGRATQDDEFLAASITADLPTPPDLNGEVDYTDFKVSLNHKFASNVIFNLSYKYTDRDNKTDINTYQYESLDRGICFDQYREIPCTAQNTPQSWSSDEVAADLTYRINNQWSFFTGASYEEKEHTSATATELEETKYWAKVKFRLNSMFTADIKYSYADRTPNDYVNEPIIRFDGIVDDRVPDEALRQSHKAERELDRLQATLRYTPNFLWSFGLAADFKEEQYSQDETFYANGSSSSTDLLGLKSLETANYTADMSYQPHQHLNITLFVSVSEFDGEQLGGSSSTGSSVTPWQTVFEDDANLLGLNLDWEIIKDRLDLAMNITYMDVNQTIDALENDGDVVDYDDIDSDETTVEIDLTYRLNPTSEVKLSYEYLTYSNNDWQYFNIPAESMAFANEEFDNDDSQNLGVSYVKFF